jgi:hypothetical protein
MGELHGRISKRDMPGGLGVDTAEEVYKIVPKGSMVITQQSVKELSKVGLSCSVSWAR